MRRDDGPPFDHSITNEAVDDGRWPWPNAAVNDRPGAAGGGDAGEGESATLLDLGFQTAYKAAHRMLRAWWSVSRPHTRGALIALWYRDEILLVKNSYRDQYTLPGGYVKPGEPVTNAAARELAEECDVRVDPAAIRVAYVGVHRFENRTDEVTIVEVEVHEQPRVSVDHREVVWAGFKSAEAVLAMPIVPHLRDYLIAR